MTATFFSGLLLVGLLLTGLMTLLILLDEHETALREFAVLGLFSAFIMMLAYFVELNAPYLTEKLYAVKFGYIGKVFISPMLLMLVIRYYGTKLPKFIQLLFYVVPILTLYLVFNCEQNQLYYTQIYLSGDGILHTEPGFFYWVYIVYNAILSTTYIIYCIIARKNLHGRDKFNNTILISACLVTILTLLIYLCGLSNGFDTTAIGVMLSSLLVALSILRYGLLNKSEILQNMSTALVILNSENFLVYANRAAFSLLPNIDTPAVRSHQDDVSFLCGNSYAIVQTANSSYQRKMSDWTGQDGRHGKLLTFDDVTEIRARLNRDAMTGLLNHASFYPMLDEALKQARVDHLPVTVSIADIDHFKSVNDTYGHANGDIILIEMAAQLKKLCSEKGDVFRYGGEEFAIIFHCSEAEAELTMQQTLDAFSAIKFDFLPYFVTFSFGSVQFDGSENSVSLFDRADQVMYNRKRAHHKREEEAKKQASAE